VSSKTAKVHHCPMASKGKCKGRNKGIMCKEHEALCMVCRRTHLKSQPCPRCDHYTDNDENFHCWDPAICGFAQK